ncbi:MAG: hypothetical protein HOV80_01285 [Polyangiaceae bacterium]|nr:hypothetical protein [Polyangiaceae bacterium]
MLGLCACADGQLPPAAAQHRAAQSVTLLSPGSAPPKPDTSIASTPAPPPPAPLATLSVSPPPGATEAEAALVWFADGSSQRGIKTVWISSATGRTGDPVWIAASREEPVIVGGSRLLAIRTMFEHLSICNCGACEGDRCKPAGEKTNTERPSFVDLQTGKSRRFLDRLASASCNPGSIGGIDSQFDVLGAVGPLVFVSENVSTMWCGAAHPMFDDVVHAVDATTGTKVSFGASGEQIAALAIPARQALVSEFEGCILEDGPALPDLYNARITWGPGGMVRGAFTFMLPSSYMCGTGPGHYSVATTLERDDLPAIRPALEMPPAWLVDALGSDVPVGITQLPSKAPRDKLLATFRSAPVPAESSP